MPKLGEAVGTSAQQIDRLERGERKLTREWAERLASALGVPPQSLLFPAMAAVPVVGLVGAGGSISTEAENDQFDPLFMIDLPFALSDDAIGFEVRGDSMFPAYKDGDIIIVSRTGAPVESVLGLEAVVRLGAADEPGDRFFKMPLRGSTPGTYDLESYNAPPMRGVKIGWASSLIARVPAAHWRRQNGAPPKNNAPQRRAKKD